MQTFRLRPRLSRLTVRHLPLSLLCAASALQAQVVLTSELLFNPGAEAGLDGWTPIVPQGSGFTTPSADDGSYDPGLNPRTGSYQFVGDTYPGPGGPAGVGFLQQMIDLTSLPAEVTSKVDEGVAKARVSFWERSLWQGGEPDYARVSVSYYDTSLHYLGSYISPFVGSASGSGSAWVNVSVDDPLPATTRFIRYEMDFFRGNNGGYYIDAFIDDNSVMLVVPEPLATTVAVGTTLLGIGLWRRATRRS